MNSTDASNQIKIMYQFILQEANERAAAIEEETKSMIASDKVNKERQFTQAIKEEYAGKRKEKIVKKRIQKSQAAAAARVDVMRARDKAVKQLKEDVTAKLADICKDKQYPALVKFLIAQSLMVITEDKVVLQCRKEDLDIVKKQVDVAKKLYQDFIKENTEVTPDLTIDISNDFLPPGPQKDKKAASCCGGVVLSALNNAIVCKNTLDSRLDLCFDYLIPQVRGMLFGVRPKPKQVVTEEKSHH